MDLLDHYNNLYQSSIDKIKTKGCETDHLINSPIEQRFGITLLIRPPLQIKKRIQNFLEQLKNVDNEQYYYPNSDIHITVMSIISCYDGFKIKKISIPDYVGVIEKSVQNIGKFTIEYKGVTASPSCIMIQGFLNDNYLKLLRNNLRNNFLHSNLEHSIDKRYAIKTAHSTVVRFENKLAKKKEYLHVLEEYRSFDFGTFEVDNLELVFNDWYQKKEFVERLHLVPIKDNLA